jgi:hypothetical protein
LDVRVIVHHYRIRYCILNSSVHPSTVSWIFEGRISGHWHSLDEHRYTQILCNGKSHCFSIESDRLVEVDAIRLRMTSRNNFGILQQMHLNEFKLSGDLLRGTGSLISNYDTPMNIVKLITFLFSELLGQDSPELETYWTHLNSSYDLELEELASVLIDLFDLVLNASGLKLTQRPLVTIKCLCRTHLASPEGNPKDVMWHLASNLLSDIEELSISVPSLRSIPFEDVFHAVIQYFESLHLTSEWNPSTAWKTLDGSTTIKGSSRSDWKIIGEFISTYCTELSKGIEGYELARRACDNCRVGIGQIREDANEDVSYIVE